MLRLSEEAKKQNKGVAVMNGKFMGPPMVIAAKKILEKHRLLIKKRGRKGLIYPFKRQM